MAMTLTKKGLSKMSDPFYETSRRDWIWVILYFVVLPIALGLWGMSSESPSDDYGPVPCVTDLKTGAVIDC
jgi:hypothetical protein